MDENIKNSEYFQVYIDLKFKINILAELNKQIPENIEEMKNKKQDEIFKEFIKLRKTNIEEFVKIRRCFEDTDTFDEKYHKLIDNDRNSEASQLLIRLAETDTLETFFNDFIREMSLVFLVAEFESFLRKSLEITFQRKPEILSSKQKSITYEDLLKVENLKEARKKIIEKELSEILSQDIEEIGQFLNKKFKIHITQPPAWELFKERFYRRNIIVHNSGQIDRVYRLKTQYKGEETRLFVSQDYLRESLKIFESIGLLISAGFFEIFEIQSFPKY